MGDQKTETTLAAASKDAPTPEPHPKARKQRIIIFASLFLVILIIAFLCFHKSVQESTDDAYVHGNQILLSSRITGTVIAINADDTALVRSGQPVVILDDSDAKVALQHAESALGDTMRKVRQFYASVVQLNANVDASKITLAKGEDDYQRRTSVQDGSVSVEDITHAKQALDSARVALEAVEQQLEAAKALVANVDLEHHPLVLQAEASVLDAELTILRTTIAAPETGYVIRRNVQVGHRVAPGNSLMIIVPLNQIWVDANYKETELKNVRIGQPVTLTSDFYGDSVKYEGHVIGLSPSTGAAFSLLPPDEGSGNWIKIMQRVPVRIVLEPKQLQEFPLRVGLSMKTVIDTKDRSGSKLIATPAEGTVYSTAVYSNEWAKASSLVQSLVVTNLQALASISDRSSSPSPKIETQANHPRE